MRPAAVVLVAVSLTLAASRAQAEDAPLFAAFRSFCIDTNAQIDAIRAAIAAAGGRQVDSPALPAEEGTTATATAWEVSVLGRHYDVTYLDLRSDFRAKRGVRSDDCSVESPRTDDASFAAARSWVGVPASHTFSDVMTMELYDFQRSDGQNAPLPDSNDAFGALELGGRVWALSLMRLPGKTTLDLSHTEPLAAKP